MSNAANALQHLIQREKDTLQTLQVLLARIDASEDDMRLYTDALTHFDGVFLLVITGEFNAGKSTLINALLRESVMESGVTPTTDAITVLSWGEESSEFAAGNGVIERHEPIHILRSVALVDTPGTNAILQHHQELTEKYVPRADLVLFVTSADRPFTESERGFLELIASWGKKVIVVVNKIDILETDHDREQVLTFVADHAKETLGEAVPVFAVASRNARSLQQADPRADLHATGIPELEDAIAARLSTERLALKLMNPIGIANKLAKKYGEQLTNRLELLHADERTLEELARQREHFAKDLRSGHKYYVNELNDIINSIERRGHAFFDENIRFRRITKLLDTERTKREFEQTVIGQAEHEIDAALRRLVDWFIDRNVQFWEEMMDFVNTRRQDDQAHVIGEVGGRFQYNREELVRSLQASTEASLQRFDRESAARELAGRLQSAVVQTGILNVSGIGLSAAVLAFISSAALDITGIALGATMVGLGFLVIPRQRERARRELSEKLAELRNSLADGLNEQFEQELGDASQRLDAALSPYTRFVSSQLEHIRELRNQLDEQRGELGKLTQEIQQVTAQ